MKLIARKLGRTAKQDELGFERDGMARVAIAMPRQGILPHDLVHFVVESRSSLRGFLSAVAEGGEPDFVLQRTDAPATANDVEQLVQVEAAVEALQSQLWAGKFDFDAFTSGLAGACACRAINAPALPATLAQAMFDDAVALNARWQQVAFFNQLELDFVPRRATASGSGD